MPEQKKISITGSDLEIIMLDSGWIHSPFKPPVRDCGDFKLLPLMNKSPWTLLSFIAGITFHGNFLKDPFLVHKRNLSAFNEAAFA